MSLSYLTRIPAGMKGDIGTRFAELRAIRIELEFEFNEGMEIH